MNELESDVWLSQKGENKGTFVACFKPLLTMKCMELFQICTFVYAFTCQFSSKTFLESGFFAPKRIKNYLWSTLRDEKLKHLALMHVESSVLRALKFSSVMVLVQFVERIMRKMYS